MPKYIDTKTLSQLIVQAQKEKKLSPELCEVISKVMCGLIDRWKFKLWNSDREDCVNDAIVLLTQKIDNIKPKYNCFSYLTTVCFNLLRQKYRAELLNVRTIEGVHKNQIKKFRSDKLRNKWINDWEENYRDYDRC